MSTRYARGMFAGATLATLVWLTMATLLMVAK